MRTKTSRQELIGDGFYHPEAFRCICKVLPSRNQNPHLELIEDGSSSVLNIQNEGKEGLFLWWQLFTGFFFHDSLKPNDDSCQWLL